MNEWIEDLDSTIFTLLKINMPSVIQEKYPNMRYTTVNNNKLPSQFPTVRVQVVDAPERGRDLDNMTVNAVYMTIQVDVLSNKSKSESKEIAFAIQRTLKNLSFEVKTPISTEEGDIYRYIVRASRSFANGDVFVL